MKVIIDGIEYTQKPPAPTGNNLAAALDARFECGDLYREVTVREYLHSLLKTLWEQGEGFSGKRPFGNSGWQGDLLDPLIKAGFIPGVVHVDEDGEEDIECTDRRAAHAFIDLLIDAAFFGVSTT